MAYQEELTAREWGIQFTREWGIQFTGSTSITAVQAMCHDARTWAVAHGVDPDSVLITVRGGYLIIRIETTTPEEV